MCRNSSAADAHCDQAPSHAVGLDVVIQTFGDLDEAFDSQVLELALLLSIAGLVLQKLQQGSNDSLPVHAGYQQASSMLSGVREKQSWALLVLFTYYHGPDATETHNTVL